MGNDGYRELTVRIWETRAGLRGAVFARVARSGRLSDRLLARHIWVDDVHLDGLTTVPDLLEGIAAAIRSNHFTPPR